MRNCDKYTDLIFGKIENDLSSEENVKLEEHLKECESCRSMLKEMTAIKEDICSLEKVTVSANFDAALSQKLEQHRKTNVIPLHEEKTKESKVKSVSIFSRFIAYAAGFAIIALGFIAIDRIGLVNENGIDMSNMQGTIAQSVDTGSVENNQLDSLKNLKIQKLDGENIYRVSDEQ